MKCPKNKYEGIRMTKGRARGFIALLLAVALSACALIGLSGCSSASSPTGSDTLRVGVRADIVNFCYLNEQTGKYYGMEIDLANEMANRLGYSKTDTRLENFDFSPVYYTGETPVMVENSSKITDINQLKDGTFGIMSGSNAGPLLAIKLFDMSIIGEEVISNTDTET